MLLAPLPVAEGGPLTGRGSGLVAEAACVAVPAAPGALEVGADRLARPIHASSDGVHVSVWPRAQGCSGKSLLLIIGALLGDDASRLQQTMHLLHQAAPAAAR